MVGMEEIMEKTTKKKLAVFALLLAVVVIGAMRLSVSAGAIASENVLVDYVNETITVLTDKDEVVYFTETYTKDVERWDV